MHLPGQPNLAVPLTPRPSEGSAPCPCVLGPGLTCVQLAAFSVQAPEAASMARRPQDGSSGGFGRGGRARHPQEHGPVHTFQRLAPSTLALSLEAVSRTSLENFLGFLGLRGQSMCPAQGVQGGLWRPSLSPSCSLGSGRAGTPGWAAGPQARVQVSVGFVFHLAARNLAVTGSVLREETKSHQ